MNRYRVKLGDNWVILTSAKGGVHVTDDPDSALVSSGASAAVLADRLKQMYPDEVVMLEEVK